MEPEAEVQASSPELPPLTSQDFQVLLDKLKSEFKLNNIGKNDYAAHYTGPHTPKALLKGSNYMRQYDGDYMNDPEEGRYLVELLIRAAESCTHKDKGKIIQRLNTLRNTRLLYSAYQKCTFLSCWTKVKIKPGQEESSDSLNHWRFYGHDGKGACIMVPLRHLTEVFPDDLYTVDYGIDRRGGGTGSDDRPIKRLEDYVERRFNAFSTRPVSFQSELDEFVSQIHPFLFMIKTKEYSDEKEVRSIVHKKSYSTIDDVLFDRRHAEPNRAHILSSQPIITDGSIIFYGPKSDPNLAIEIQKIAEDKGIRIKAFVSSLPYR